jgi:NAD(P)-dependent dehydrogenase (short-subunit alcohol dehydrogenase family)
MSVLDLFRLDDRVVIVTGASSGLGVSFAEGFAEAGADLVLGARRVDRMSQTAALVEQAGARVCTHQTDVTDPEQCQQLMRRMPAECETTSKGHQDCLVNRKGPTSWKHQEWSMSPSRPGSRPPRPAKLHVHACGMHPELNQSSFPAWMGERRQEL